MGIAEEEDGNADGGDENMENDEGVDIPGVKSTEEGEKEGDITDEEEMTEETDGVEEGEKKLAVREGESSKVVVETVMSVVIGSRTEEEKEEDMSITVNDMFIISGVIESVKLTLPSGGVSVIDTVDVGWSNDDVEFDPVSLPDGVPADVGCGHHVANSNRTSSRGQWRVGESREGMEVSIVAVSVYVCVSVCVSVCVLEKDTL